MMNKKIAIVDYGVGNLYSLAKALGKFNMIASISEDANEILSSDAIVLPGVGSFEAGMNGLKVRGLIETIRTFAKKNKPILGICLGAQLLLSEGREFGIFKGLGIIPGKVIRFSENNQGKIPHMGWNQIGEIKVKTSKWKNTILDSIENDSDVYFVHSYILEPLKKENILALTQHSRTTFCSAIKKDNVYGCQFHPEKSGEIGLKIIKNFIDLV